MKRYACILLALLFAGCAASRRSAVATAPQEKQYAVILSMDAFRWDLAGRSHTPTLDSLARVGTYAEIYPVYPSNTFPSHYAMATGLHPDHHGVVNNGFYDRTQGRRLSVFESNKRLCDIPANYAISPNRAIQSPIRPIRSAPICRPDTPRKQL
nr:alkaline phosphatase family protein [Alistipes finegoldii]